jgi:hypothetical protein
MIEHELGGQTFVTAPVDKENPAAVFQQLAGHGGDGGI